MYRAGVFAWVLLLGTTTATWAAEDSATLDLGGLRQVRAVVTTRSEEYVIQVTLRPVRSFDRATNDRLSRDLARQYALQALARHLSGAKAAEMTVSGARVTTAEGDGKSYTLTLSVPRTGVVLGRPSTPAPPRPGVEAVVFDAEFFTRKRDYRNTVSRLAASLREDVQSLQVRTSGRKAEEAFALAIAELEERGLKNLEDLATEVRRDSLLLFTEKEELADVLAETRKTFLDHLSRAVREQPKKQESRHGR